MPSFPIIIIIAFFTILLTLTHGINSELLLEEGYSVTTLIDGDKFSLNPNSVLTGSSSHDDVIVLDSVRSSVFTVSFLGGEVSEIKKLSGNAKDEVGYRDGDLGSAKFNKPKSFAIDIKNNIYIADKSNHVIRKISKSGINSELLLEEGYSVTTLIDGDKFNINPNSVLTGSSLNDDVIVLDSVRSSVFTVSFIGGEVSEIKKLSGNVDGKAGYKDGDLGSAEFNKPKSFAIDKKNNIYIADKSNHVIRKISKSGVTTIAGGNIKKAGKADGPAQNASFSDDFELAFDPQRCALLIADHGNRLVRQLNLKAEDCADNSSGSVLGSTAAWGIGLGVACFIGLMAGFVIRPYVLPYTGRFRPSATQHDMEALPNESGETSDLLLRHEKRTC